MPIDYETLRVIWWLLLGVLLAGFAVMDGFDLGAVIALPFLGKNDDERRVIINCIGPVWEGNQVWFILGGGAIFAAWPLLYAVSFSGFYLAMMLVLIGFILRPVSFKFRSKIDHPSWRQTWDVALFISGLIPALIFGVAIGNVLQGVPFHFDTQLRVFYSGNFFGLLNPFGILCGLVSIVMITMHGSYFLATKVDKKMADKAAHLATRLGFILIGLFAFAGLWLYVGVDGYILRPGMLHNGPSNPILHAVIYMQTGAWFRNYAAHYALWLVPSTVFIALGAAIWASKARYDKLAFISSAVGVFMMVATVGCTMFPFILPSSEDAKSSLLVWDSSSSHLTLFIMLIAVVIFLPIVLSYTAWVYHILRGRVSMKHMLGNDQSY